MILFANDRAIRRERVFLDRRNPLESMNDDKLIARYRFPRHTLLQIVDLVKDDVQRPTARSVPLSPVSQVCLHLFAHVTCLGPFYICFQTRPSMGAID